MSHVAPHADILYLENRDFSRDPRVAAMDADPLIAHETQPSPAGSTRGFRGPEPSVELIGQSLAQCLTLDERVTDFRCVGARYLELQTRQIVVQHLSESLHLIVIQLHVHESSAPFRFVSGGWVQPEASSVPMQLSTGFAVHKEARHWGDRAGEDHHG
jgi:hypothetical protein